MLKALLQGIIDGFALLFQGIVAILPTSPFKVLNSVVLDNKYLGWLAWIIPFPQIIGVLQAWVGVIIAYYIYMVILRWIKAIG